MPALARSFSLLHSRSSRSILRAGSTAPVLLSMFVALLLSGPLPAQSTVTCNRQISADVVALDQVYYWNRLGAFEPQGMIYALERDVVHVNQPEASCTEPQLALSAGNVRLRKNKRPRPLVLRMNVGDCLTINFRNLLAASPVDQEQPATRAASVHVVGLQYVSSMGDGGMKVGQNTSHGVVPSGGSTQYTLYAQEEGTFLMYSGGAMVGGQGDGGSISAGLFGAVNVQPTGAEWYRSQVTEDDLGYARLPSPDAYPRIDYDAVYTSPNLNCHPAGTPVLDMLSSSNEIVHSDLTAIITGPNRSDLPSSSFEPVHNIYPDRYRPYREFTIIFHDETGAVQAFPHFEDEVLAHTLHSARDAFAINYGTGGAGAEVLANRLGVGPMHDCVECKYEEFFLTSWVVGDPAMVVDVPANDPCTVSQLRNGVNCNPTPGPKATKVFYPDDPSNVYHSYLNDHVKFRNLHAGIDDHHIFHLHAHQWLHTPNSDKSSYHDSQAIGQGGSFTYEIAYHGSGNRNKTPGDSIFHCHFYPHFAQGMWSLWRVHDVLETGTELDEDGRPIHVTEFAGTRTVTRALPDGEIEYGTPIPAVVPIPREPMAPVPANIQLLNGQVDLTTTPASNPGFPFFIPARAGHRPPHPPLDTIDDGGLSRHIITDGVVGVEAHNRLNFEKEIDEAVPLYLSELGEPVEDLAMNFHAAGSHATVTPSGTPGSFLVNDQPRVAGAPFADPCGDAVGFRLYKAADIQMDVVLNKAGWHFPQQRMITLWGDVTDTLYGRRPPEPFFFRAHDNECIEYQLTNLVPNVWEVDDFEVRTPTDILGQHIHLVKFDVLASDGAANGFNYEDGSFSPEEVQERIRAIRKANGCPPLTGASIATALCPVPQPHPYFGTIGIDANCNGHDDWLGAQTTVQRWWADPVKDNSGVSRTLRTIFTHDHFGPSTHQQAGLYAGLVIEERNTTWYENEGTGVLGGRFDGGPTSWQARIEGGAEPFREFLLEFADFQLAYEPNAYGPHDAGQLQMTCPDPDHEVGFSDPANAINPPAKEEVPLPKLYAKLDYCPVQECDPDGPIGVEPGYPSLPAPCPEAFSALDPGFVSVNYRSEPVALRVNVPGTANQTPGEPGDLSFVYESRTDRANTLLNGISSPLVPYADLTSGLVPGDPFTPLLRSYEEDAVTVRVLVGAHEEEHNFAVHGLKWKFEPDDPNSGWRGSQMMGISEYFDLEILRMPSLGDGESADFLYKPSASNDFQWNGAWGLFRLYRGLTDNLPTLSDNPDASGLTEVNEEELFAEEQLVDPQTGAFQTSRILCPRNAPRRTYNIKAVAASAALPGGTLVYNSRQDGVSYLAGPSCTTEPPPAGTAGQSGPLHDPTAILFVHASDLDSQNQIYPGIRIEPLILRAVAGECVVVQLENLIPSSYADLPGFSGVPMIIEDFNANDVKPSLDVGLHPKMVAYDVRQSDGNNVGTNRASYSYKQTVAPGQTITYYWYAGQLTRDPFGNPIFEDIEFGTVPLSSSDPIKHSNKGAVGALIIEPRGATWQEDFVADPQQPYRVFSRASATVSAPGGKFKEFVVIYQDDVNLRYASDGAVANLEVNDDPTESGQMGINYRTEPIWFRYGHLPQSPTSATRTITNFDDMFLSSLVGSDPQTPFFEAGPGDPVRMRVVHPAGDTQNQTFELHGHIWQEEPYISNSQIIGNNPLSNWHGLRSSVGPTTGLDAILAAAGGGAALSGDFLYRTYVPWATDSGTWSFIRIDASSPNTLANNP